MKTIDKINGIGARLERDIPTMTPGELCAAFSALDSLASRLKRISRTAEAVGSPSMIAEAEALVEEQEAMRPWAEKCRAEFTRRMLGGRR